MTELNLILTAGEQGRDRMITYSDGTPFRTSNTGMVDMLSPVKGLYLYSTTSDHILRCTGAPWRIGKFPITIKDMQETEHILTVIVRPGDRSAELIIIDPQLGVEFEFGTVVSVRDMLSKSILSVPIVSLNTDQTFGLESTTANSYTIEYRRRSPPDYDDYVNQSRSDKWSNAAWMRRVSSLTNRWQARQGGYQVELRNYNGTNNYPEIGDDSEGTNVYITSHTMRFMEGQPDVIAGVINLSVGGLQDRGSVGSEWMGEYSSDEQYRLDGQVTSAGKMVKLI